MRCPCRQTVSVRLWIPGDLSSTGAGKWKLCPIDYCIASIVTALQKAGINMRGSCCGHGKRDGEILLQDGRKIIIEREDADARQENS